jgi:phenolic acid decarboxylase
MKSLGTLACRWMKEQNVTLLSMDENSCYLMSLSCLWMKSLGTLACRWMKEQNVTLLSMDENSCYLMSKWMKYAKKQKKKKKICFSW